MRRRQAAVIFRYTKGRLWRSPSVQRLSQHNPQPTLQGGTGRLRGLLCFQCNVLLGKIEKVGLRKITDYLRRQDGTVTKAEASPPSVN